MKKLVLLLVSVLIAPAIAYASGNDPEFRVESKNHTEIYVQYSWPGEGKEPMECTVTVEVRYVGKESEYFKFTHKIHNTGSGWADFDSKSGLNGQISDVSVRDPSCR